MDGHGRRVFRLVKRSGTVPGPRPREAGWGNPFFCTELYHQGPDFAIMPSTPARAPDVIAEVMFRVFQTKIAHYDSEDRFMQRVYWNMLKHGPHSDADLTLVCFDVHDRLSFESVDGKWTAGEGADRWTARTPAAGTYIDSLPLDPRGKRVWTVSARERQFLRDSDGGIVCARGGWAQLVRCTGAPMVLVGLKTDVPRPASAAAVGAVRALLLVFERGRRLGLGEGRRADGGVRAACGRAACSVPGLGRHVASWLANFDLVLRPPGQAAVSREEGEAMATRIGAAGYVECSAKGTGRTAEERDADAGAQAEALCTLAVNVALRGRGHQKEEEEETRRRRKQRRCAVA